MLCKAFGAIRDTVVFAPSHPCVASHQQLERSAEDPVLRTLARYFEFKPLKTIGLGN